MGDWVLGVIGGSGLYAIDGLEDVQTLDIETPWGAPSGPLTRGRIGEHSFLFLPRHGPGYCFSPTDVPYRANIAALKLAGASDILSVSAVGSLREDLAPGDFVVVDQFIDRTFAREKSFFGPGLAAHVSLADPVCSRLSALAERAARAGGASVRQGGTYLAMEGPQFSTRAESRLYRQWGCDVIGMTAMPEAKLAREAELPYAIVAMVTDYDCWREEEAGVEVSDVLAVLSGNAHKARRMLIELAALLPNERSASPIDRALDHAIMTAPAARDPAMAARLGAIAARALRV